MESNSYRTVTFYKEYFAVFYSKQTQQVKDKILWTFRLIEELSQVPECYLKHLTGTEGLYEIRVQCGRGTYRAFCFFDEDRLIIVVNGFQKKTQKTPRREMTKALALKKEYYEEKKQSQTS